MNWPDDLNFETQRQRSKVPGFMGAVNFPERRLKSDPVAVTWFAPLQHSPVA